MGTLKVILKQDIPNLGEEGDVKVVKRGFARNYLFPRNLVTDYSKKNRNVLESKKDILEKKKVLKRENAASLKEKLEKEQISIAVSAGDKGRLFGTVTSSIISEKFKELELNIDKKSIELKDHIKFSGKYKFRVHLYEDIYAEMDLEVVAKIEKSKTQKKPLKKQYKKYSPQEKTEQIPAKENTEIKEEVKKKKKDDNADVKKEVKAEDEKEVKAKDKKVKE